MPNDRLLPKQGARAAASPLRPVLDRKHFRQCDWIAPDNPEVCELLEQLDDVIFAALAGCDSSLEQVGELWPIAELVLGETLLEESREQYLRRAQEIADRADENGSHGPQHAAALAIVQLLRR